MPEAWNTLDGMRQLPILQNPQKWKITIKTNKKEGKPLHSIYFIYSITHYIQITQKNLFMLGDTNMPENKNIISELNDLCRCANISLDEVSEDKTMKEIQKDLENIILETYHKYQIYFSKSDFTWRTYIPDETKTYKRKLVKRKNKDDLKQFLVNFYKSQYLDKSRKNTKLRELYKEWMIYRRDETAAKSGTIRKNKMEWNKFYENSVLADMKITDIKPIDLIRFFRKLTKDRTYTRKCITNIRSLLSGIFSYAVEEEIITHNPILDVDFKKFSYKPVENQSDNVFTRAEAKKLLAHLKNINEPYSLAIQLAFCLFIRIGELKALKWENVNLEKRSIYLNSQITQEPTLNDDLTFSQKQTTEENYIKGCTSQGYRTEYLTDNALEVLKKARELNSDGAYIFMPYGRPINTERFNIYLKKYCENVGIPYHSSHKIRFYTASTAYNGHNLVTISKMMGHSQTATTMHYLRDVIQNDNLEETFRNLG